MSTRCVGNTQAWSGHPTWQPRNVFFCSVSSRNVTPAVIPHGLSPSPLFHTACRRTWPSTQLVAVGLSPYPLPTQLVAVRLVAGFCGSPLAGVFPLGGVNEQPRRRFGEPRDADRQNLLHLVRAGRTCAIGYLVPPRSVSNSTDGPLRTRTTTTTTLL